MMNDIIDETRYFVILHKHGEKPKTLRPPLGAAGLSQMIKEKYAEFPSARLEVLTVEIEKSDGDLYHLYKSGVELYPIIKDAKEYIKD